MAAPHVTQEQVAAFRLSRHHLSERASPSELVKVLGDIAGAQAQVLLAAQISAWDRVRDLRLEDLEDAIWRSRTLVRAWCMRRTMYLLPSKSVSLFVRGSTQRAMKEVRWVLTYGISEKELEKMLDEVLQALDHPRTQTALGAELSKYPEHPLQFRRGGGWGSKRKVAWVKVGRRYLPVGYLLHLVGARGVVCSGPNQGTESTFVRADRWLTNWKDMPIDQAEGELLSRYLRAFGPATVADFTLWTGMRMTDAKEIWSRQDSEMAEVEVEGEKSSVLRSDLDELMTAELDRPSVRILPYFDSFVLGHKSHRNIVDARDHTKVYRNQGWVSPIVLVDGRAAGVWSHTRKKDSLEVRVEPFSKMPALVSSKIREEADDLGRFLGCRSVHVKLT